MKYYFSHTAPFTALKKTPHIKNDNKNGLTILHTIETGNSSERKHQNSNWMVGPLWPDIKYRLVDV